MKRFLHVASLLTACLLIATPAYPNAIGNEIGDLVWNDLDMDGIQDTAEPGVGGVTVNLYDNANGPGPENLLATTMTASDGLFLFYTGDSIYDYFMLEFDISSLTGFQFTHQDQGIDDTLDSDASPSDGRTAAFFLGQDQSDRTWDAGVYGPINAIPEPSTLLLLGTGLLGVVGIARRRKS